MSIVTTVMTNVIIRKADKDSVNITIEADTKIPHDTELMADLAKLGSCKPDEVKLSDIKTGTVIMMVANSPLSSS